MRAVHILRRLVYFILVVGGIVFLPYFLGKLDQKYGWMHNEYLSSGADTGLIWMGGVMVLILSGCVIALVFFFFKWLITGKVF